jgi:hypothetical protein
VQITSSGLHALTIDENKAEQRELYVVGTAHPSRFLVNGRAPTPILKGHSKLGKAFLSKYGTLMKTVSDDYLPRKHLVLRSDKEHTLHPQSDLPDEWFG